MQFVVLAILFFSFAISSNLPKVTISFYDENGTFIKPNKRDYFSNALIAIPKNKTATIVVKCDKTFTDAGDYYLIVDGANLPTAKRFNNYNIFHFKYDKSKDIFKFQIPPAQTKQYIAGAVVYTETQYFEFQNRVNRKLKIAFTVFGMIMAIILYSFSLFISLKNRLYLHYSMLQFGFLIYAAIRLGVIDPYTNLYFIWSFNAVLLALFVNFSIYFLKDKIYKNRVCIKVLYLFLLYAIISAILFAFKLMLPFYGSFALLIIFYCALRNSKTIEVKIFALSILITTIGTIYIEFFPEIWQKHVHPLVVILPSEAILMLIVISLNLKRVEKNRKRNLELLVQYNKEKSLSTLVASMAHSIKNRLSTLSFIVMNLEFNRTKQEEIIKDIKKEIKDISLDVNNYLNIYKIDSSKEDKVNLYELFNEIIKTIKLDEVKLVLDIDKNIIVKNRWAVKEIALIVINNTIQEFKKQKISNAKITITYKERECKICDNAKGNIDTDNLDTPKVSTKDEGSGIGLYIANIIATEYFNKSLKAINTKDGVCIMFQIV